MKQKILSIIFVLVLLTGCASIPPEAPELSAQLDTANFFAGGGAC